MRTPQTRFTLGTILCFCLMLLQQAHAQGYGTPLTMQGLGSATSHSAASRAMGGITFATKNDVSLMFANPAALTSIDGLQISLGAVQRYRQMNQDQRYGALQGFSAFSLLTESMTDRLSDPDTTGKTWRSWTQADSVQRPFDTIKPDWNRAKTSSIPIEVTIAAPLTIGGTKFIVGLGAVEYANLDWYFQNNNAFSPSVLSVLNGTIATGPLATNPYLTQWYQYTQERTGSIYGYGAMVAASVTDRLSIGLSGMLLQGSTDDTEARVGRGRMAFYAASLRLDKQGMTSSTKTGTSDFSGMELTGSAKYATKFIDFGFSVKAPTTITRKFSWSMTQDSVSVLSRLSHRVDSVTVHSSSSASGEDKIELPWRGSLGLALRIRDNITIGVEYEIKSYESASYTGANGQTSNPWLSGSVFHIGGEFRVNEWLALRAGAGNVKETFEPASNPIRGDAVSYPVYSAGAGISFANAVLNVTYEYSDMKYVDMWSNAASINQQVTNALSASLSYSLP